MGVWLQAPVYKPIPAAPFFTILLIASSLIFSIVYGVYSFKDTESEIMINDGSLNLYQACADSNGYIQPCDNSKVKTCEPATLISSLVYDFSESVLYPNGMQNVSSIQFLGFDGQELLRFYRNGFLNYRNAWNQAHGLVMNVSFTCTQGTPLDISNPTKLIWDYESSGARVNMNTIDTCENAQTKYQNKWVAIRNRILVGSSMLVCEKYTSITRVSAFIGIIATAFSVIQTAIIVLVGSPLMNKCRKPQSETSSVELNQ